MKKLATTFGIGLVLALGATALLPGAAAASLPVSCPNKTLKLKTEETPPRHFSEPVKMVRASSGFSCAQAYEIVRDTFTGKLPGGWKIYAGSFTPPQGLAAELAKKGSKQVQFAAHGG